MRSPLKAILLNAASRPYWQTGWSNYYWARGKLRFDPYFSALLSERILPDHSRVLDLGCGRGLLAAWLLAAETLAEDEIWTGAVRPPHGLHFRGVDLMARDADCGNRALQPLFGARVGFRHGDLRDEPIADVDVVTMLDVLHYIPYGDQEYLLDRIRSALSRDGLLVTRIGNSAGGVRFAIGEIVDRVAAFSQGHRRPPVWCRPVERWVETLRSRDFQVEARFMSGGTPFANVMLIARAT